MSTLFETWNFEKGQIWGVPETSTNVARNMKYLNFLICAGGENFDGFQTIGDKLINPTQQ